MNDLEKLKVQLGGDSRGPEAQKIAKAQDQALLAIIGHYGPAHQREKAIEEMIELMNALKHNASDDEIAGECADVIITVNQLLRIHDVSPCKLQRIINSKLQRQLGRIQKEQAESNKSKDNISKYPPDWEVRK